MKNRVFMQLRSFSLLELIIALVISSIVISGAFVVIGFVNSFLVSYRQKHEFVNELVVFARVINKDLFEARGIMEVSESAIQLVKDEESVFFYFLDSDIVREIGAETDTFNIKVLDKQILVGPKQDYMSLHLDFGRDSIPLFFKVLKYNRLIVE